MVPNNALLEAANTLAEASQITYLESMISNALGKTNLEEARVSIVKYKGKYGDDIYTKMLPQLKQGAEAVLGDTLASASGGTPAEAAASEAPPKRRKTDNKDKKKS